MNQPRRCPTCGCPLDGVTITAEFDVPSLAQLAREDQAPAVSPPPPPAPAPAAAACAPTPACSWCGLPATKVRKLLTGGSGVGICDGCVALCCDILRADLPGWAPPQ